MKSTALRIYRGVMRRLPYAGEAINKLAYYERFCQLGNYYSPIPHYETLQADEARIFNQQPDTFPGIDLNAEGQAELLTKLVPFYAEMPFAHEKQANFRYAFNNNFFEYADAIYLYSILRYLKPRRIIEIGSGFSSCVILDTNELFFDNAIDCTFIEPDPERFYSQIKSGDTQKNRVIPQIVQEVDQSLFSTLEANDILLIDSSHVTKAGSDVNLLFFEVLPRLASGVWVHIHDVFYPFEYPKEWIYSGRSWNEAYLVRAFLQYNSAFQIQCFGSYLQRFQADYLQKHLPLVLKSDGQSLWIKRL